MAALIQFANGAPGIKYSIDARILLIGRGTSGNDICLPCGFVSKHHARIEVVDKLGSIGSYEYYLEDLGSTNRTYVNDKPISREKLEDGDVIRIGKTTLKFDAGGTEPFIAPIDVDVVLPDINQSRTWKLSRRLTVLGAE